MIYLDSCSTTKPSEEILKLYQKISSSYWHHASSLHKLGQRASAMIEMAKKRIKDELKLSSNHDMIFTNGGTEANNFAIYGICNHYLAQNKRIITTQIEHPSVYYCFADLKEKGFDVIYLSVDKNGIIDLNELKQNLTKDTILVSIQWVNNIVGSIQPIDQIVELLKKYPRIKFHIDGVQGIGKTKFTFDLNDIDLFTISAHKINGLKGSGVLIHKKNISLNVPLKSSPSGNDYPGTMDVGKIACLAKAIERALEKAKTNDDYISMLHRYLFDKLSSMPGLIIHGGKINYSPYILNFSIPRHNSETIMHALELKGIYVGIGSACSSKTKKPEKTILSITNSQSEALSSIRIGLSIDNTKEEIDLLIDALKLFCS